MSNSPYPELKALSDGQRTKEIDAIIQLMKVILWDLNNQNQFKHIANDSCLLTYLQQHLDRIKQLIMTRGNDAK